MLHYHYHFSFHFVASYGFFFSQTIDYIRSYLSLCFLTNRDEQVPWLFFVLDIETERKTESGDVFDEFNHESIYILAIKIDSLYYGSCEM